MGEVIKFPTTENQNQASFTGVAMTIRREHNGMSVVTNVNNLSKEELLSALLGDAIMKERQELAQKYIAQ